MNIDYTNYLNLKQMAFVLDKVSEDTFYENILLGLTKILEKHTRAKNVFLQRYQACSASEIINWEQMHGIKLPDDLKSFYLATNGFKLSWDYVLSDNEILPVGLHAINQISDLTLLTDCKLTVGADMKGSVTEKLLQLNCDSKAFQLISLDDHAQVCLIYNTPRSHPNIFLVDPDFQCYFLAKTFIKYFCMAVAHLGLPFWQYCFTKQGVPSWVEQMFNMMAPHLPISKPVPSDKDEISTDYHNYCINKLDSNIFKSKIRSNKNNNEMLKYRKKH